ncbi:MAG: ParB/RepB/Spo0J family partition protein [Bdellovibrionales bacterium]
METQSVNKKNRLGRGLDSLLGPSLSSEQQVLSLDIEKVFPNKKQPRKDFDKAGIEALSKTIKKEGVLSPILVQAKGENYEIIAGERRWRASLQAGMHKIPAIIKSPKAGEAPLWALIENLQREDLNPIEQARAYELILKEQGLNQEKLAQAVGVSRSSLTNSLRLLQLDPKVQEYIEVGKISFGQAKEILKEKNQQKQRKLAEQCTQNKLTVRSLAGLGRKKKPAKATIPFWVSKSLSRLEKIFSNRVQIDFSSRQKGKISFTFHSEEELKGLLNKLGETDNKNFF